MRFTEDKYPILKWLNNPKLSLKNVFRFDNLLLSQVEDLEQLYPIGKHECNVSYVSSPLWFTTLIKSDAFKVSGHFRLQPCGEGMLDRKLIWIKDFQKEGYTRIAKKELE